MKKKVLLKSVAAVMSVLTLAPYFWGVTQVEAGNNKLYNLSNPEGEQRSQYKRQRCSNEEIENEEDGIVSNQCKRRKAKTNPEEVGKYIVENEATYEKAAENFGVSVSSINNRVKELCTKRPELFENIKEVQRRNRMYSHFYITPEEVGKYIVENKVTYAKAAGHFGVSCQTICRYIDKLRDDNSFLYDSVRKINQRGSEASVPLAIPEAIGNYTAGNEATYEKAAENFGVAALNPKPFENIKNICQKQLTPEEVMDYIVKNYGMCAEDGIAINQSDRRREFNLKELVTFILKHTYITHQELANYFGVSEVKIDAYLYRLKEKDELLYNTIKNGIDKPSLPETAEEVYEFIFYTNATSKEVASYYGDSPDTVNSRFRSNNFIKEWHKPIANFNRQRARGVKEDPLFKVTPEEVGKYIVENRATYKQTAKHFKTTFMPAFYAVEKLFDTPFYDDVKKVACGFPLGDISEKVVECLEESDVNVDEKIRNAEDGIVSNQFKRRKTKTNPEEVGKYIVENRATYAKAVKNFDLSRDTLTKRVEKLKTIDLKLFEKVKEVLRGNRGRFKNKDINPEDVTLESNVNVNVDEEIGNEADEASKWFY